MTIIESEKIVGARDIETPILGSKTSNVEIEIITDKINPNVETEIITDKKNSNVEIEIIADQKNPNVEIENYH